ncbi:hypothetical protein C8K18_11327 [Paraburkholderia sp. GV068]|uniref:hypothetical protein n=1 Tax=Paraburkholderia TaxID=1822464 RepID=UPI000D44EE9E|nr:MULTISPECIES: hypothetical protein [Paraburkholderia]MDR6477054.1 hypothetical protein [Paraburkholderia graminis]PTQ94391.1 hypothetical protein C8K19_114212 [Paraburkholderia sp. GV072]PUB01068.1 hypothetical protein C8K18_11327 [Paraburkholderia sp. GV068]
MTKSSGHRRSQRIPPPVQLRMFRPISWYNSSRTSAGEYICHISRELGRLGMDVDDIESHDRSRHGQTVLSDLISWMSDPASNAFSKLFDWKTLDLAQMQLRLGQNSSAKPRIELSAHITKMNNLSVRWHPGGWKQSYFDWNATGRNYFNLISQKKWPHPPDFHWFEGDESSTFNSRASNELMYIRGVGNLEPEPEQKYGPYATYNRDVVASILICAVRSAYEGLIERLRCTFEVDVVDAFHFETREEPEGDDARSIRRVISWSLEDANELRVRREQELAAAQEQKDRSDLANITSMYGFTPEMFVDALVRSSSTRTSASRPSDETVNRKAAKDLRGKGFNVDSAKVRRIRQLIEHFTPEMLPEALKPVTIPQAELPPGNIVDIASFR